MYCCNNQRHQLDNVEMMSCTRSKSIMILGTDSHTLKGPIISMYYAYSIELSTITTNSTVLCLITTTWNEEVVSISCKILNSSRLTTTYDIYNKMIDISSEFLKNYRNTASRTV